MSDTRIRKANIAFNSQKAYLAAEGTEKARNSEAIIKVERFLRERDRTEAVKEFTLHKLRDAQAAVSARQSLLAASLRTNALL